MTLDKYTFTPGETITGKATLRLNSPKQARALRIDFYGEILQRSGKSTSARRVHAFSISASGERTYNSGETIPFSLIIPSSVSGSPPSAVPAFFSNLMAAFAPKPTWYVHASLDSPLSLDINKRVQIVLLGSQGKPL